MHAGLSDGQRELRDSVRSVLAAECPPSLVRETYDDPERWRGLWKTVLDLGWTELATPSEGLGNVELALVVEELGRAAAPIPYVSSVGHAGIGDVPAALLATGPRSRTRDSAGSLATALTCRGGRLVGTALVADAVVAERFTVLAATGEGDVAAGAGAVGAGAAGAGAASEGVRVLLSPADVSIEPGESLDPSRPTAWVSVDVAVGASAAEPVELSEAWARPLLASAAELVGVSAALLGLGVGYAKQRVQFGQAIGSFQGVKHRLADAYVQLERARSLVYLCAATLDEPSADVAERYRTAVMAKAAASEAALIISRSVVQVHGAIAQTWEHDVHLFVRRAWHGAASIADARVLYRELACS